MSSTLNRVRGLLGLALGAVLFTSNAVLALQPPRPGELKAVDQAGELQARQEQARALGNNRTHPRLVWQLRKNLMKAAGATDAQITSEIGNAPPPDWRGGLPSKGTPKTFVLLVDFDEYPHGTSHTLADIQSKFFGDGNSARYPYESLRNYYKRASYDQLTIQGTVFDWYRAQHPRTYYQNLGFGKGEEVLMKEAIQAMDAQGHDFTQYDNDNDGTIDSMFIKWTGPDNGWSGFWWAYQWSWHVETDFRVDNKKLGSYVWSWVANPTTDPYDAQVDIHESGHLLGLPDLYDYNGGQGPDGGVGGMDMMDYNWGDHNCFSKYMLDWLTPTVVATGEQTKDLNPTGTSKDCVLIMPGVTSSTLFGEFFMAQYRKRGAGNDPANGGEAYPTDGLVIWHIDSTLTTDGSDFQYDNSYTEHKYIRLMEADGLEEIGSNGSADAGDFYLAPKTFATATTPNSRNYLGKATGVTIDQLGAPGSTMSARFRVSTAPEIVVAGSTVKTESCPATNGAIDPYETVTVNIQLSNIGISAASNLTATLQPTGGVTSPSGPQAYGTLQSGGQPVGRDFTFTSEGSCGGTITLTLALQAGSTDLGTVSFTNVLGAPVVMASENFDSVTAPALPTYWTVETNSSTRKWVTKATTSDTSPNVVFAPDTQTVTDIKLISPSLPILTASAKLKFRHRYDLEISPGGVGYDGGALEIAIGQSAFVDVLAAGCTFESGGYNTVISTGYSNPLAGRQAWSGKQEGFFTTVLQLPASLMGQTVKFRWRVGTDNIVAKDGWYVDTIVLEDGFACCDPLAIVVDKTSVVVPEASTATFQVKLASEPTGDVVVTPVKQTGGDADLTITSGSTLTFNASNWNVYQTVTLADADDPDAVDGSATFICQAAGRHDAVVMVTEDDDNSYDFRVIPETVSVPENGTATFQVKLGAMPLAPLTVAVAWAEGDSHITVQSGATLSFTPDNWDTYQQVTLAAAEDGDAADEDATILCSAPGWPDKQVRAVEDDNDILAVEVNPSSLTVSEEGTNTFQVRLTADPLKQLSVRVLRESGDTSINVKPELALKFGSADYNVWQTVIVSAASDPDAADGQAVILCKGTGVEPKTVTVTEADDDTMEIVIPAASVLVPEGLTGGFPIKLGAQPVDDVFVTVSISGDPDVVLLSNKPLQFTADNWNQYQTVTLVGEQDDDIASGQATITCSAQGMLDKTITALEADNDALAIVTSASAVEVQEMSTVLFTVKLAYQPNGPVSVTVETVPGDPDITLQSATTLLFTPTGANAWNVPQPVIVGAVRDFDTINGKSAVRLSGPGLKTVEVTVNEIDDKVEPPVWYADADGDGAGDANVSKVAWDQPAGYVANASDCDDTNAEVHPAAAEQCGNEVDDNCDGSIDEDCYVPPVDTDKDGIADDADQCPNTPAGVAVGTDGCPLPPPDADGDGVIDAQDACPNTPSGTQVGSNGCPLPPPDADSDSVPDSQDQCPNTPAGTQVGSNGCPLPPPDADGDSVPDSQDQCPNTPAGTQVGSNGCPLSLPDDADGDTVPDSQDQCPNTPAGTRVDANGCTVIDDSQQPIPDDQNPSGDNNTGGDDEPAGQNQPQDNDSASPIPVCGAGVAEAFLGMLLCMAIVQRRRHV